MFRRRRFNLPGEPGRAGFEAQIAQAHRLFEDQRYPEAGAHFEQLGRIAESRGGPRAPRFFLQAGRAWLHAGDPHRGMQALKHGWDLASRMGRQDLLARVGPALISELTGMGLNQESRQVEAWLGGVPARIAPPPTQSHPPALPLKCPSCGASVNPQSVEWLDDQTAECYFCGSSLRGS